MYGLFSHNEIPGNRIEVMVLGTSAFILYPHIHAIPAVDQEVTPFIFRSSHVSSGNRFKIIFHHTSNINHSFNTGSLVWNPYSMPGKPDEACCSGLPLWVLGTGAEDPAAYRPLRPGKAKSSKQY
jgi:hypothetical protein